MCQDLAPIAIIGLGYVGIQLATAFSEKTEVIGFDIDSQKIALFKKGCDPTHEVGDIIIQNSNIIFTDNEKCLLKAKTFIIAVPTPVDDKNEPDLQFLIMACQTVGKYLSRGCTVVFESTVYPGVTETICLPILKERSGLSEESDFFFGYSPERLSPGEDTYTLKKVTKLVSGVNEESKAKIQKLYELIIDSKLIFPVKSIKTAEASKILENTQRDVMIALMNECAVIFHALGLDIQQIIDAASTKWNFYNARPGLVGGHCIGVDPYYLIHMAKKNGFNPKIIVASREVNEYMSSYIVNQLQNLLCGVQGKKILIYGISYKENVSDIRNAKTVNIVSELMTLGATVLISDHVADKKLVKSEYGLDLCEENDVSNLDAVIFAVKHSEYYGMDLEKLKSKFNSSGNVILDPYRIFNKREAIEKGYCYWSL